MVKMDVKHEYHNIAVHPEDSVLLGVHWDGKSFIDKTQLFGLWSAPLNFSAVADAMQQWVRSSRGEIGCGTTWMALLV